MTYRAILLSVALVACGDDDGGGGGADAPPAEPTAFRFDDLDLRDPHILVSFNGCTDVTNEGLFVVNNEIKANIDNDDDGDGSLDLNAIILFRPLNQGGASSSIQVHYGECAPPAPPASCGPGSMGPISATANNMGSGTCLSPVSGTTNSTYTPAITTPSGPCFVSDSQSITFDLSGIIVNLQDAQIAATYEGDPATGLMSGLLVGFLTEAEADATLLPEDLPLVGGMPVSSVLPGGTGNCATWDDKDDNGGPGWWFYLNFHAQTVGWSGT